MGPLAAPGAVVCVPARDEAERLPTLLRSLAAQHGFGPEARLGVVVVANGCRDGTAEAARGAVAVKLALRVVEVDFPPAEAHVGSARRMALEEGASWLAAEGLSDGVLLSTDADARLPPDWVAANLAALAAADIVGGALVVDPDDGEADPDLARLDARIARYWAAVRAVEDRLDPPPHDPAPRHGDHTGASLALRAELYRRVGGLPPLPAGEDNALVARVVEAGGRLRHDPAVRVLVSGRTAGRAAGGMAADMKRRRAVLRGAEKYRLPAPGHWHALVARRAALRRAWREGPGEAAAVLARLGLPADGIAAVGIAACPNDIAFVERAGRRLPALPADEVPLEEALSLFETPEGGLRGAA